MLVAWKPLENVINNDSKQLLTEIAEKYGRTETQIALNWLISQDNVVVISKTGNPEHLEDNLGALGWNLSPNDIEQLRKEFPGQKKVSDVYSLK
jgi:diketogulonate reductase-like aldo/keto reductase